MSGSPAKRADSGAIAEILREASIQLGISLDRLTTAIRASQALSSEELKVVASLVDFAQTGAPLKKRSAVSRGIVSALKTIQEADDDPLASVDEPMSTAEAAEELALAEVEIQANRELILKDSISAAAAAELTGRSRQAIERLRRTNRLLALRSGNQWRYPRWQFEPDAPGGVLPGLGEAIQLLDLSPAGAAFWFLQPYKRLGGVPPAELLRRHRPEPVLQLAREHSYMP
jgi:hypothetical protein